MVNFKIQHEEMKGLIAELKDKQLDLENKINDIKITMETK